MNLKPRTAILSCLVLLIIAASGVAQPRRQTPAKAPTPPAPAPTPPPTLDTLLAADTYRVYGEVRSVGQFIKSSSVNEILEPILQLAAPPKEFRTVIKWLNLHADEVVSSRLIFAGWPSTNELPTALVAIEFASPDEANKFQQQLNPFLKKMIPAATPTPAAEGNKSETPAPPPYYIQQAGSLVLITPTPLNFKKLRPAGSKLLAEDANFRIAHNRFNTESIFFFFDVVGAEKEDQQRIAKWEEEEKKAAAERAANPPPPEAPKVEPTVEPEEPDEPPVRETTPELAGVVADTKGPGDGQPGAMPISPVFMSLGMIMGTMGNVPSTPPAAIAVGLSLEGESFDLRALLVNAPGQKSDPIPFLPVLAPGPAIAPETPGILPADTETLVTMSLDLPQIYASLSTPRPTFANHGPEFKLEQTGETEPPLASLEKQLKIKIKDDLLPLIGSEIAVSIPSTGLEWFDPPKAGPTTSQPSPSPSPPATPPDASASDNYSVTVTTKDVTKDTAAGIVIAVSLKDKEGMRTLLPKIIENVAFKGASALAQTERREDTELVSYMNAIAYAFIGNFLVISPNVTAVRHVVDSYLKHETLSGEPHFKNYTRWQPRQVQGQVYISPSLMENYRTWAQQPNAQISEPTRAFLAKFSVVPQPITYSLSNEGFGPLHELHVPKNLVLLMVAAASGFSTQAIDVEVQTPDPKPPVEQQPKLPAKPNERPF
ncbi:MAG TPA: DUF3352 domain-containing protein [Pyrinomonadaceae bacterium]|nr:DUF3352 domain-containing protein [Pyrinomonadaceae bacterium]